MDGGDRAAFDGDVGADGLGADGLEVEVVPGEALDDHGVGAFDGADEGVVVLLLELDAVGAALKDAVLVLHALEVEPGGREDGGGDDGGAEQHEEPAGRVVAVEDVGELFPRMGHVRVVSPLGGNRVGGYRMERGGGARIGGTRGSRV